MVQVVSFRKVRLDDGNLNGYVVRVWDGQEINSVLNHSCQFVSDVTQIIVPQGERFDAIPESFFVDVLVFGEWIRQLSTQQSGSIVVLKNIHSNINNEHKNLFLLCIKSCEESSKTFTRITSTDTIDIEQITLAYHKVSDDSDLDSECAKENLSFSDGIVELTDEDIEAISKPMSEEDIISERKAALAAAFTFPESLSLRVKSTVISSN
ncbi:hypothetical protein DICVIV_07799 [Dictyocaulus viviparus]|uniref:Uncharacterized protein n=1 Tax=Dictyocaulus viviparus TaxID=29172 RepID=A0A0D8XUU2_DICVI|nr:hypothetical protein DICVIV_07799 [Dictyocaulus viviparus]